MACCTKWNWRPLNRSEIAQGKHMHRSGPFCLGCDQVFSLICSNILPIAFHLNTSPNWESSWKRLESGRSVRALENFHKEFFGESCVRQTSNCFTPLEPDIARKTKHCKQIAKMGS